MVSYTDKHLPTIIPYLRKTMLFIILLRTAFVAAWLTTIRDIGNTPFCIRNYRRSASPRTEKEFIPPALSNENSNFFQRHTLLYLASIATEEDVDAAPENPKAILSIEGHSGLSDEEFAVLVDAVENAYAETVGLSGISCETKTEGGSSSSSSDDSSVDQILVGTLRRVLSVRTNLDEESAECLRALIAERVDHFIYESGELKDPVLVSVQTHIANEKESRIDAGVDTIIRREIEQYGLRTPIHSNNENEKDELTATTMYKPIMHIEIDGAETSIESTGETFWDTSSVVVFDDLVSDDLRGRLLDVVKGKSSDENDWDDINDGPDPNRWIRGGLTDIPENEEEGQENDGEALSCWGLPAEAIEEICFKQHDAIEEFESILTNLFPQFAVSRLPEAVYGESVSPLTANAPVAGEEGLYDYHIDGDPLQTPPSPWTDVYGRYPNRSPGKPRFVSCLVYLNSEWDDLKWAATTKFYDPPTDDSYEVVPRPGRCVIMDQDLGHTVTPPKPAAGKRPRYSLVWKLVLHPKTENQDMAVLSCSTSETSDQHKWPDPILFGSAASRT